MDDEQTLAETAYAAYGDQVGWKNYRDLPMPNWQTLGEPQRDAWRAVARAVLRATGTLSDQAPVPDKE